MSNSPLNAFLPASFKKLGYGIEYRSTPLTQPSVCYPPNKEQQQRTLLLSPHLQISPVSYFP